MRYTARTFVLVLKGVFSVRCNASMRLDTSQDVFVFSLGVGYHVERDHPRLITSGMPCERPEVIDGDRHSACLQVLQVRLLVLLSSLAKVLYTKIDMPDSTDMKST